MSGHFLVAGTAEVVAQEFEAADLLCREAHPGELVRREVGANLQVGDAEAVDEGLPGSRSLAAMDPQLR